MFQISYSKWLRWEVNIWASKNATLPIVAANYLLDEPVHLTNKPDILDLQVLEEIFAEAKEKSKDFFDLTMEKATKIRTSILLIPYGLCKYWKVKFVWSGGCNIGKRPLDTFDDWLIKAWIKITNEDYKVYEVVWTPKKNIMMPEFSVTAVEALLTYLAFAGNFDYDINIYQVAIEPHVRNLIDFLNNIWADITLNVDHTIVVRPSKIQVKDRDFTIISDYVAAGTYFAIWAWADDSEITIKNVNVDDLSSMYSIAERIWIDFKIIDKNTIKVNSFNKKNYNAVKFETRIFPWFPTDLQSIFGTLLTQANWISKIFETLFEWRFGYLNELENLWAKLEILNPHQALIIWPTKLRWNYVSSTDLRWWWAMVLAGIMAEWTTNIMNEKIILRWYENIVQNLQNIWVNIKQIEN